MKVTSLVVWPIAIVAVHHLGCASAATNTIDVGSCAELQQAVDLTVNSGNTEAVLTADGIACDEWTTFEIQNNRLKLVAEDGGSFADDQVYAFENVRFLVTSGVLRADVALSFTTGADDLRQEVNGGVLNVAEGGYARFLEDVSITDVTIQSVTDESSDVSSDTWNGGCIYNQGRIRFEAYFAASDCATVGGGESAPGDGGGIFNGDTGDIVFKGEMEMSECGTFDNEGNAGAAIYNDGTVTMFKASNFFDNACAAGGAIRNTGTMKFLKNAFATFSRNRTYDGGSGGGQVSNSGTLNFNGGVIFEDGFTEEEGGAISNSGAVIIQKSAVFRNNASNGSGGAISSAVFDTFELPDDTTFEGNEARNDRGDCDNWYQRTTEGSFDFVCLFE